MGERMVLVVGLSRIHGLQPHRESRTTLDCGGNFCSRDWGNKLIEWLCKLIGICLD